MSKRQMVSDLRQRRKPYTAQLQDLVERAKAENRNLTQAESADFDTAEAQIREIDERIDELAEQIEADAAAAPMQRKYAPTSTKGTSMENRTSMPGYSRIQVTRSEEVYRPDNGTSYFKDLYLARELGDRDAAGRLHRNQKLQAETRAISGNVAGAGGEFVPPKWLEEQFIQYARPGRVTVDRCNLEPLPAGTDQLILPKINTGTATAIQTTQNSAVQNTDLTTTSVSSSVATIAGAQTLSLQLIEQSPLSMDSVVLGDLAADYAMRFDLQVLAGTGTNGQLTGILTQAGTNAITFTSASPTLGLLYSKIAGAIQAVHTSRFLPPDTIIMHPRRWAWCVSQLDAQNRPLVVPVAGGPFNAAGVSGDVRAQGYVGELQGLPVFVDANVPTNLGAGSNEDRIIVARMADLWAWESNIRAEAFQQTYAQNMSVLVRLYNYVSFQPARFPQSISVISGTGLTTPSF
ncbi:phage major capsid protein [Kitasatospora sp. NPDC056138]|uniref:phage major capsid protein n=1 Tax=Kitasatospora sp. NPDC056138 TaxID=3345724 RepID=UPI0035D8994B